VNTVDFALREGILNGEAGRWRLHGGAGRAGVGVPDSLRQMIERQLETLPEDDRQALEAGSVVGAEFSVAAVAAALQVDAETLDDRCEGLAWTGQFVTAPASRSGPTARWRPLSLRHALYRDVTYARVAPARRARMHRRIAERKVAAFGSRAAEIAGELSAHFEAARDVRQAVTYRRRPATTP
jgi:predicted ATPase